jgi:uncharacterized repeat protein (TIGR01451 family)
MPRHGRWFVLRRAPGILIATVCACLALAGTATPALAVTNPDLTVSATNSVSGATTLGHNWTWTLHVANGPASASVAVFGNGQTILSDDLENSGLLAYGVPAVANATSVTGSISCSIALNKLTCKANGSVDVWGGGSFDVTFTSTPSYTGTFSNPRLFGTCQVDPNNVVSETDESNNGCNSDSVFVTAPELQINLADDVGQNIDQGGSWNWTLSVTNTGSAPAVFPAGTVLLQDDLDASGGLTYGTPTVKNAQDITGTIACSIDVSDTLTCKASGGPVSIGDTSGAFDVNLPVTGTQTGGYLSPRDTGICRVDPNTAIVETDPTNNDCSPDQVNVYRPVNLGVTDVGSPDPTITGGANGGTDNLTHTIVLTNYGPTATTGARVLVDLTNALPASVQLDSASATAGSFDQGTGYWTVGSLANGQSVTLTLTFSVGASAPDNEKIITGAAAGDTEPFTIDRDSTNDDAALVTTVIGAETPQTVSISPGAKDFGNERLNTTSAPQTFTVANNGTSDLHISTATITGADAAQYTTSSNGCDGATLTAGAHCTVGVSFHPTTTGAITTAYFEVASDAQFSPSDVVLHGTGTISAVSTSPSSHLYGNQIVGTASAPQTFTITNSGGSSLGNLSITPGGSDGNQYTITNNTCPATLAANSACTVGVAFSPTTAGAHNSATLDVASDDPSGTVHLSLSGTGIAPVVAPSPSSADFGNRRVGTTSAAQTFTITNTGNGPLTITGASVGGTDSANYVTSSNGCVTTLAVSGSCSVDVAFAPTSAGTHNATLDIVSNDPTGTTHLSLTGVGIQSVLSPSMSSHDFGSQRIGTTSAAQRLTITNAGTDTLGVSQLALSGSDASQFTMTNDTCSSTQILPGSKCNVDIAFKPVSLGAHPSASLDIPNDSGSGVVHVGLSGTGTQPALSLSTRTQDFGGQRVGTSSSTRRVTVTNSGAGALDISAVSLIGGDADQYTLASDYCSGRAVAAGTSCMIDVMFLPGSTGTHPTTLAIRSDAPTSPDQVSLTGSGTVPAIALSPTRKDFGAITVGTSSPAATFTISNPGTSPLTISTASLTGADASQYARAADHCTGKALAPNATCAVQVVFRPTSIGTHAGASLVLTSDAGTVRASLSGRAIAPSNAFTVAHVKVQKTGVAQFDITIHAPGIVSAVTTVTKIAVFGQTRVRARGAGTVRINVSPGKAGRKLLKRRHVKLRVRLVVSFTPTLGAARKLSVRGLNLRK